MNGKQIEAAGVSELAFAAADEIKRKGK